MKLRSLYIILAAFAFSFWMSCDKPQLTTSPDARLEMGIDTLRFDTVFTGKGTITRAFVIRNPNRADIIINRIYAGNASGFQLNINGMPADDAGNIRIRGGDSIYVFVRAAIDPTQEANPFVLHDSIRVEYNTQIDKVMLNAWARNAVYIKAGFIEENTTWHKRLPIILTGPVIVDENIILQIEAGTEIFAEAGAPFIVNGTLKAMGGPEDGQRIVFRGSRLDAPYSEIPGTWPGILLNGSSRVNNLQYVTVLNAYKGLTVYGNTQAAFPQVLLNGCIFHNHFDAALHAINGGMRITNSQFTQSGNDGIPASSGHTVLLEGGRYSIEHSTLSTYSSFFTNHRQPTLAISNQHNGTPIDVDVSLVNSIVYGKGSFTGDEILLQKSGNASWSVQLDHLLYEQKSTLQNVMVTNALLNVDPLFDTINTGRNIYRFTLRENSPAIDAGKTTTLTLDLLGNPRLAGTKPDLGSYEAQ